MQMSQDRPCIQADPNLQFCLQHSPPHHQRSHTTSRSKLDTRSALSADRWPPRHVAPNGRLPEQRDGESNIDHDVSLSDAE